jgi:hypothetical protein
MNLRSHTIREIQDAFRAGKEVWQLDTGNDGSDDVLIGDPDGIETDILSHFDIPTWPDHFSLYSLSEQEFMDRL